MTEKKHNNKTTAIVVLVAAVAVGLIGYYKTGRLRLVDKSDYKTIYDNIVAAAATTKSDNAELKSLQKWTDRKKLDYVTDSSGNMIVTVAAASGKEDQPTTVIAVEYNSKTMETDASSLATAKYIASNGSGTPLKVVFLNDSGNLHSGAENLIPSAIPDNSNVFFLDSGSSSYISTSSFAGQLTTFSVDKSTQSRTCDSAVKITIKGCTTGDPRTSMSSQPNPIDSLSTLLTYLKGKSVPYEISDLKVGSNGNMYPDSLTVTVLVNSYTLTDLTTYLDKRSESFKKTYSDDYPDASYTYEVLDDASLPSTVYSSSTTDSMTNLLFTIASGVYRFDKSEATDEHKEGDPYAFNCFTDLKDSGDTMKLTVSTSALSSVYMDQVAGENEAAAKLNNADINVEKQYAAFSGNDTSIPLELANIYTKTNAITGKDMTIQVKDDTYVTPCSLLGDVNGTATIVHICIAEDNNTYIANMLMNYIAQNIQTN